MPSQWSINMLKMLPFRIEQCLSQLPCCLLKGPLKWDFLGIYLTTFLRVRSFGNTSAMRVIFFLKVFKIFFAFQKGRKSWEIFFCLWDNSVWIGCVKLSLLRREYLLSAVNALTNSLETLHITKRDFFELNCLFSDQ